MTTSTMWTKDRLLVLLIVYIFGVLTGAAWQWTGMPIAEFYTVLLKFIFSDEASHLGSLLAGAGTITGVLVAINALGSYRKQLIDERQLKHLDELRVPLEQDSWHPTSMTIASMIRGHVTSDPITAPHPKINLKEYYKALLVTERKAWNKTLNTRSLLKDSIGNNLGQRIKKQLEEIEDARDSLTSVLWAQFVARKSLSFSEGLESLGDKNAFLKEYVEPYEKALKNYKQLKGPLD